MDHPHPDAAAIAAMPRWQAAEPDHLDWAAWDGEYVLFHQPSARTHLVNAATRELLTSILLSPRSLPEVEQELSRRGIAQEEGETLGLLLRLEELGLIDAR